MDFLGPAAVANPLANKESVGKLAMQSAQLGEKMSYCVLWDPLTLEDQDLRYFVSFDNFVSFRAILSCDPKPRVTRAPKYTG